MRPSYMAGYLYAWNINLCYSNYYKILDGKTKTNEWSSIFMHIFVGNSADYTSEIILYSSQFSELSLVKLIGGYALRFLILCLIK